MKMDFGYNDYLEHGINYHDKYSLKSTLDRGVYRELRKEAEVQDVSVNNTLEKFKERTTSVYYNKIAVAQGKALEFSRNVFPAYNFIMPDAITDDWLSTMGWHKKHPTRDHSLHQTLTTYIISKMLGNGDPSQGLKLSDDESLLSRCANLMINGGKMEYLRNYLSRLDIDYGKHQANYNYQWAVEVFYETATIAAQFHDMGYPWNFINNLAKGIAKVSYDEITGMLLKPEETLNIIRERLLIFPFLGYNVADVTKLPEDKKTAALLLIRKGVSETHGMPGALGFMSLNDKTREFKGTNQVDEATSRLILDWAAVGIMMHDMPGIYWGDGKNDGKPDQPILRLDFETDPLSCLISMADILEEFERPLAIFEEKKENEGTDKERVRVGYNFACDSSRIGIEDGHLLISYFYKSQQDPNEWKKIQERRANEVLDYLNPDTGYIDLRSWGIVDVKGLALMNDNK